MPTSQPRPEPTPLDDPVVPPTAPAGAAGSPAAPNPIDRVGSARPGSGPARPAAEPAPGLGEQIGATRASGKRLIDAHLELARAEFADIADAAKRAAALAGIAIAAAIFAALLVGVGTPLWLGEWIFGSIGWGILLGLLLLGAVALAAISVALRPSVDARVGRSFVIALVIGIVVGVIFGLDVTNRAWSGLADNVVASWPVDPRPLYLALAVVAVIGGIGGLVIGLASGMGAAAIGSLVASAIAGAALGALTAAAPGPRVGAAIGVAAGLIAWIALMGSAMASRGFDMERLKDRFWPSRTIEVTKETIEWARERMPLKRPS